MLEMDQELSGGLILIILGNGFCFCTAMRSKVTFVTNIQGPQMMSPNDFSDLLSFPYYHQQVESSGCE